MKAKYILSTMVLSIISAAILFTSCTKNNDHTSHNYLRLSHGVVNVSYIGTQTQFSVESDLHWNLKFSPATVGWAEMDKTTGNGNTVVTIKSTQAPLPAGAVRSVDIIATAENNPLLPPVRLMLLQHDSTYKK